MPEKQHEMTLRFLAEPSDVNILGKVHGGEVMKWIDHAGYACAAVWCGQHCVTVYVSGIRFYKPIHIGDIVEVHARLLYTARTSMHIAVDVSAADPRQGQYTQTTRCIIVFVAVNDRGVPIQVPTWTPKTEEEIALEALAKRSMELRKNIDDQLSEWRDKPGA